MTIPRLRTYHEQALDSAALIAALATSHTPANTRLDTLRARQDQLLDDLLHDFAYKARKTIEHAKRAGLACVALTERNSVMGVPAPKAPKTDLAMYSIKFILDRIIHSEDLVIERAPVPSEIEGRTVYQEAAWAFAVRSDWDKPGIDHFLFIEFLLDDYLAFAEDVTSYLERSGAK